MGEQTPRVIKAPAGVFQEYVDRVKKKQTARLSFEAVMEKKRKELRQHACEKDRLLDLSQGGSISLEAIEPRLTTIRAKGKKIAQESALLEQEKRQELQPCQLIAQCEEVRKPLEANFAQVPCEEKKALVRLRVSEVVVDVETEEITVRHTLPVNKNGPWRKRSPQPDPRQYMPPLCPG